MISTMWANNEVGTVSPIAALSEVASGYGIPLHTDAVQAVGSVPVDFAASGAAALSLTAHKLGGPYGTGALLLRRDVACVPLLHGGGQERDVRSGTLDTPGVVGLATAAVLATSNRPTHAARIGALRDRLVAGVLDRVPDAVLNGSRAHRLPGNAHFSFPGCEGDSLLMLRARMSCTPPAAKGTMMCPFAAKAPIANVATASQTGFGATAMRSSATHDASSSTSTSARRSYLSPSGTKKNIPTAVPAWLSMATVPAHRSGSRTARRSW